MKGLNIHIAIGDIVIVACNDGCSYPAKVTKITKQKVTYIFLGEEWREPESLPIKHLKGVIRGWDGNKSDLPASVERQLEEINCKVNFI